MRVKKAKLEWNVLYYSFNNRKVENFNIFRVGSFKEDLHKKVIKKEVTNLKELKEFINRHFQYYCHARAEYEIMVGDLFPKTVEELEKIDVYRQVEMNLDRIVDYVNKELRINFEK